MTPWEKDVADAMREALAGRGNPDVARVLAAEIAELRRRLPVEEATPSGR